MARVMLALTRPGLPVIIETARSKSPLTRIDLVDNIETQLQEIEESLVLYPKPKPLGAEPPGTAARNQLSPPIRAHLKMTLYKLIEEHSKKLLQDGNDINIKKVIFPKFPAKIFLG